MSEQVVSKGITGWNGRQVVVELTDVAGVVWRMVCTCPPSSAPDDVSVAVTGGIAL